jgi:Thioesterase-like superfamily
MKVTSGLVHTSFFEQGVPGTFRATPATAGPWSPQAQHGGPPSALAVRELERHEPDEGMRLARVAVDILRPVPVGTVTVSTRTVRPGKRVALVEAVMNSGGQEVLHARAWRIARSDGVPAIARKEAAPAIPDAPTTMPTFHGMYVDGYVSAIDWRFVSGGFDQLGPCMAWGRPRIPLLPGEDLSPMARALLVADSGSGVSAALDPAKFTFINVDLTVVLQRDPVGDWLLLDALTTMGGNGTGLCESLLYDGTGVVGTAAQTLLVAPR